MSTWEAAVAALVVLKWRACRVTVRVSFYIWHQTDGISARFPVTGVSSPFPTTLTHERLLHSSLSCSCHSHAAAR